MSPESVAPKSLATNILDVADELRLAVNGSIPGERRSELGQFMTPAGTARFMASLFAATSDSIRLLDPGAAVGTLTAAFVDEACRRPKPPREIHVSAFEIDQHLAGQLEQTLDYCREKCAGLGIAFESTMIVGDFVEWMVSELSDCMFSKSRASFTHVIMNPPYRKIRSNSDARRTLARAGIETTNLYSAFMALAVRALEPGGEFVSITPRSFCNGPYFRSFRRAFVKAMTLDRIHIFDSRKEAFRDDEVLQESVVLHARRATRAPKARVAISSSDSPRKCDSTRTVRYDEVVRPGDEDAFIHLVVDAENAAVANQMRSLPASLEDLGLSVSTGKVVDFRALEAIRHQPSKQTVPLLYPCNLARGGIEWPREGRKPQAIVDTDATRSLLIESGYYVLVKRFSAKEERRRVVAALLESDKLPFERVGIENHLNYYHVAGRGMCLELARGLCAFLNCSEVDKYFRQFNGHTQVNASDLRKLHYPTSSQLTRIGGRIVRGMPCEQEELDAVVSKVLGWPVK